MLPQRNGGLVVWKLSDLPSNAKELAQQIAEGRGAAADDGYQSPTLVVLFDRSEAKPELKWFLGQGVIVLEDTPKIQELLASFRDHVSETPAAAEVRSPERWVSDPEGYLVLSSEAAERPAVEPSSVDVYQALLDGLNAQSSGNR